MGTAKTAARSNGAAAAAPDVDEPTTEHKLNQLIWLHDELMRRHAALAAVVAELLAEKLQPQMRQAILSQLMGGKT